MTQVHGIYNEREAKQLFSIAMYFIDGFSSKDLILNAPSDNEQEYSLCIRSLNKNIPIQYHFGMCEFDELIFKVNQSVLIPRPETLELVLWIEESVKSKSISICDIGTGSGCIAISLAKRLPLAKVSACDKYPDALKVAQANAELNKVSLETFQCDILNESIKSYDLLVSNPPYIPLKDKEQMSELVLQNEPHTALFVEDSDPLVFYKRIVELAQSNHSLCFFEIHEDLKAELEQMLYNFGVKFKFKRDMQGKFRMLKVQT